MPKEKKSSDTFWILHANTIRFQYRKDSVSWVVSQAIAFPYCMWIIVTLLAQTQRGEKCFPQGLVLFQSREKEKHPLTYLSIEIGP